MPEENSPDDSRHLLILYGSQTGTAQAAAEDFARDVRRRHIKHTVRSLDSFDITKLHKQTYVVFFISTTGQGDPPENMRRSWTHLLRKDLSASWLKQTNFTVFGLGDRRYVQFNFAARKLWRRLEQLGASSFYRLGLGDDMHDFGYEGEFDPWVEGLLGRLLEIWPLPEGKEVLGEDHPFPRRYKVEVVKEGEGSVDAQGSGDVLRLTRPSDRKGGKGIEALGGPVWSPFPFMAAGATEGGRGGSKSTTPGVPPVVYGRVEENEHLAAPGHSQDCRRLRISTPPSAGAFVPGDVAVIRPAVSVHKTLRFLVSLNLHPATVVQISENPEAAQDDGKAEGVASESSPFPSEPLTLFELCRHFVDSEAVPTRWFFRFLSFYCDDQMQKEKLEEMSSKTLEGKDLFYEYCKQERRSCAEVLWDFPASRPPLEVLLEALPPILPRKYSVCSAPMWTQSEAWRELHRMRLEAAGIGGVETVKGTPPCALSLWRQSRLPPAVLASKKVKGGTEGTNGKHVASSSSSSASFEICVGIVKYKTRLQREIKGLASDFLSELKVGDFVPVSMEASLTFEVFPPAVATRRVIPRQQMGGLQWTLPRHVSLREGGGGVTVSGEFLASTATPLILICPGTGLAPCRALIQERHWLLSLRTPMGSRVEKRPRDLVFLGFRHRSKDFLFEGEWPEEDADVSTSSVSKQSSSEYAGWLSARIAFSRDDTERKVYVQDKLEEAAEEVTDLLLNHGACIGVCGRAHPMPSQVRDIIVEILEKHAKPNGMSKENARAYLNELVRRRRYIEDTWG
uniref:Flavodoxin-like domain-containing protein n=1 Tax=Chromera velia CCMP2878 TaxID=1169474 RepID=A0A0G4FWH7_9ALVE|eukprot:Cvel_19129.t1-p1 / transcript=Cvel_19129.t1 / gene=Cvel_19129 / organism=Chromera_velia_CCMP2878 / gene_product=NADPH-dependent diflavin oxidoreductase 1, putative / transcript_product=NADPH-dependent diflavin oxidoreductase 1, putative / location=Cvel_scaffold1626:6552-10767(+) / protein_length=793 / sequence_SO=supercontig / SO=protein_coding / is_pseudo=false